jgi:hypothetical protein
MSGSQHGGSGLEHPVHRADGAEIGALIQQFCVGFGWCLVGERVVMEDI